MRRALPLLLASLAAAFGAEQPAQRIASYSPGATQTLRDLGAEGRIVAATRWCPLPTNHPAARTCDAFNPDLEALLRTKPELVILPRLANPLWAERCERAGLRIVVLQGEGPESVRSDLARLASATGCVAAAEPMLKRLSEPAPAMAKTLLVVWDGMMAGPEAYTAAALKQAGFKSPLPSGAWIKLDWEILLKADPDAILWIDSSPENTPVSPSKKRAKEISEVTALKQLKAIKAQAIFETNSGSDWLPGTGLLKAAEKLQGLR